MSQVISYATPTTAGYGFGSAVDEIRRFQTFTLGEPITLDGLWVKVRKASGTGQHDVQASLRNVVNGVPGPIEYASGHVPADAIGTAFATVPVYFWSDPALSPGQYALVLWQQGAQGPRFEWAVGPGRVGERFGKGTTPTPAWGVNLPGFGWVDETNLGAGWLMLFKDRGEGETIDVTSAATLGNGFGNAVDEIARFQTFRTTRFSQTLQGIDVRVRRYAGTAQSDVVAHLHATAGGHPTGEPLATTFIAASSIGTSWTTVHADLRCGQLAADAVYAIVLTQRVPQAARYEWARSQVDLGLAFGKWNGSAWVDEAGLGDGWLKVWGTEERPMVLGSHTATTALGFGNSVDEVRRYQVVDVSPHVGHAVWGVDLKLRRAFGDTQSDLTVILYAAPDDQPVGAPLASATVPAAQVGDAWSIVHAPVWLAALPAAKVAIVVGQAAPRAARYEWAVGGSYPGRFGKWTGIASVDESRFGSAWFRLWADYVPAIVRDVSSTGSTWYGFGNVVDEQKRYQIVSLEPMGIDEIAGVELKLRSAFGTGQSDVVVQLDTVANGVPAGWPLAESAIPGGAIDGGGRIHRVLLPYCQWQQTKHPYAIVLGQRTPKAARYEWATGANAAGQGFGKWNGTRWVSESQLGAGWVRVWSRKLPEVN